MSSPNATDPPAAWQAWIAQLELQHPQAVLLLAELAAPAAARIARAALSEGVRERWTAPEAALRLGISRRTTLRWAQEGLVDGWKDGRADSEAWKKAAAAPPRRGRPGKGAP